MQKTTGNVVVAATAMSTPESPDVSADPLEALSASLEFAAVGMREEDPSRQHPRMRQLKRGAKKMLSLRQEKRRKAILESQKKRRDDYLVVARKMVKGDMDEDGDVEKEEEEEEARESEEEMEAQEAKSLGQGRLRHSYRDQLMLSEWFDEIPQDFPDSWSVVAVPVGKRSLVVAGDGETRQYGRGGRWLYQFPSALPGGFRHQEETVRGRTTLLDCIYDWEKRCFYVLDVMMWGDESFYDSETGDRFGAVAEKLSANPELGRRSRVNPYPFLAAPTFGADEESVYAGLCYCPFRPDRLDGLLCYHRRVQYLPGRKTNPLVLWLKAYMVPELMGWRIPQCVEVPADYRNAKEFVQHYKEEHEQRKKRWRRKEEERRRGGGGGGGGRHVMDVDSGGDGGGAFEPMTEEVAAKS